MPWANTVSTPRRAVTLWERARATTPKTAHNAPTRSRQTLRSCRRKPAAPRCAPADRRRLTGLDGEPTRPGGTPYRRQRHERHHHHPHGNPPPLPMPRCWRASYSTAIADRHPSSLVPATSASAACAVAEIPRNCATVTSHSWTQAARSLHTCVEPAFFRPMDCPGRRTTADHAPPALLHLL